MSSIGTGYDLSAGHFSPDGRVFQVEYAQKAVDASGTAVAAVCKDGVVFAVEKIITSKLYEAESNRRIFSIDTHVGCAVAGLLADAKHLVEIGHDESANYRNENGENIPIKYLAQRMSLYAHAYTLYGALRPFGCSALVGGLGHDNKANRKPFLFLVDPAGTSFGYHAVAIGKAKQNAKTELEKILPKLKDMSCLQLAKELAKIIYLVHDDIKDKHFLLEMSWITRDTNERHQFVPESVLNEAEAFAKAALAEQDADS